MTEKTGACEGRGGCIVSLRPVSPSQRRAFRRAGWSFRFSGPTPDVDIGAGFDGFPQSPQALLVEVVARRGWVGRVKEGKQKAEMVGEMAKCRIATVADCGEHDLLCAEAR